MYGRKWGIGVLVLFICFALALGQFFRSTARIRHMVEPLAPDGGEAPRKRIVLVSQELDNPYWRAVEEGARAAGEEYGMDIEYTGPYRINPEEQLRLLDQAIASRADGILIQGTGDSGSRALVSKAAEKGIPVVAVDADEPDSGRTAYTGTDNEAAGAVMAELVAEASGGSGRVGILAGTLRADSQRLRVEGFRRALARYPELTISGVRTTDISRLQAANEAEALLSMEPPVRFIVGFSSLDGLGALDAAERLKQTPELPEIFAFDDLPDTVAAISQGLIRASVVQEPRQMGREAVALLRASLNGQPVPEKRYTPVRILQEPQIANTKEGGRP
jgi:ribose transport system substrate-binding protein